MTKAGAITNFSADDDSASFKLKEKTSGKTAACGTKNIEIIVPLKIFK